MDEIISASLLKSL